MLSGPHMWNQNQTPSLFLRLGLQTCLDKFDKAYSWGHPEPSLSYAAIALGCWGRVLTEHLLHSKLSLFVSSC